MKHKLLNAALIITSLFGYMEWGKGSHALLFSAEWHVIKNIFIDPVSVVHPFTIIPIVGQFILFVNSIRNRPNRILTFTGIACLGILLVLIFLIGVGGKNVKMVASSLPFLLTSVYTIVSLRKKKD